MASLERLAAEIVSAEGLEVVELQLRGSSHHRQLRIDIDRAGPRGVDIADCQRVSQAVGRALDETELIPSRFVLEVSSPGVDRPIVTADDYRRNTGRRVVVVSNDADGRQLRHQGELLGLDRDVVRLRNGSDRELKLPLDEVVEARQQVDF